MAIINYDGPDPLQPRIDYVDWMEQTHFKHGRDCNLIPLLEDTITLLKDNEKYKQDSRFIEFIVKYINTQENSAELFQMVYSQGLGTMCSVLYIAWAEVLESASDFKRADQVYSLGIANRAQPLQNLRDVQSHFQMVVTRKLVSGELSEVSSDEPSSRQVLGKLKKDPGSLRRTQGAAGVLTISKQTKKSSKNIAIFQDDQNFDHLISGMHKNKLSSIATAEKNNEENTIKAGTWNKGYNRREVSRLPPVPSTPSFKVHVDPENETTTPKVVTKTPCNVLKTRKAELLTKVTDVFSVTHSAHKPLQSNLELYHGGAEFSFEELRAAYYKKKKEKGYLITPSKHVHEVSGSDATELTETPANANLFISRHTNNPNAVRGSELFESAHETSSYVQANEEFSLETPLKWVDFMPLTPSVRGVDFGGLEETPGPKKEASLSKPTAIGFNIYADDHVVDKPAIFHSALKSYSLPTIDENPDESNFKLIKNNIPTRKKLFSEQSVEDKPVKSKSAFTIFVDED